MSDNLIHLLPPIKRARGYRLYDIRGRRYLDLWQNNGRAILGHRAYHLTTHLKNVISCGLIYDIPSVYQRRLEKELARYYPAFKGRRIVASHEKALELISLYMQEKYTKDQIREPVQGEKGPVCYDRPFVTRQQGLGAGTGAESGPDNQPIKIILPVLPFGIGGCPWVICFREMLPDSFPEGDILSPVLLAGTLRAMHDLKRYQYPAWYTDTLLTRPGYWQQQGLYVWPVFQPFLYNEVFKKFLQEGILLSPEYGIPSIIPAEASPGELHKLQELFNLAPGPMTIESKVHQAKE